MPLTPHGQRMMDRLESEYHDPAVAKRVFFASINARKPGFKGSEPNQSALDRRMANG